MSSVCSYLSHFIRKSTFCICENKGADQPRSNIEADQHLCLSYTDSTFPLLKKNFQPLAIFCACTAGLMSDLFGNHIVCLGVAAHLFKAAHAYNQKLFKLVAVRHREYSKSSVGYSETLVGQ